EEEEEEDDDQSRKGSDDDSKNDAPVEEVSVVAEAPEKPAVAPKKRGKGRPKGSKNKKQKTQEEIEEQAAKKKKKKKKDEPASHFSPYEDVLLCKAFISTSEDPIVGTDQTKEALYDRVHLKYNELLVAENADPKYRRDRKPVSCYNRLKRKILPDITLFNPIYRKVIEKNESGKTMEDKMNDALDNYHQEFGSCFKYHHCLEIIWQIPLYDPMADESGSESEDEGVAKGNNQTDEEGTDTGDATDNTSITSGKSSAKKKVRVNDISKVQGSNISRPIGRKKSKDLAQKIELKKELARNHGRYMQEMGREIGAPTKRLADVIEEASRLERVQKLNDQRLAYVQTCLSMGQEEKANEMLEQIHKDLMAPVSQTGTPQRGNLTPR
ncbi:MAG: hypothetical protein ACRCZI_07560, partial [Cetobacterium sp.]